jgi:hypothetical protein
MIYITGEAIQVKCEIYIANKNEDFLWNPNIGINTKNVLINTIDDNFDNPKIIFCYGHCLKALIQKLKYFQNPFILISGNSDENICNDESFFQIANHSNLIKWYTQNLAIDHTKIKPIPIGIANVQWPHGNLIGLEMIIMHLTSKTNNIYFQFSIHTNPLKRQVCYNELCNYLQFLDNLPAVENWKRLASYKFCICPEGNGYDSHRIWECYYLKVVPIVLDCDFIRILKKHIDIPMIILQKWTDLIGMQFNYEDYKFPDKYLNICDYIQELS